MSSSIRRIATRVTFVAAFSQLIATACDPTAPEDPNDQNNLVPQASLTVGASTITATAVSWSEIDLTWQASASASGYQIFRSTTGASGAYTQITSIYGGVSRYVNVGLTGSTEYCYEVRSFKNTGKSTSYGAFSSSACATTLPPPIIAPSDIDAVPQGSKIVVKWKDNSDNEDGFRIEASSPGQPSNSWSVPANATFADFSGYVLPEQQWCFRVYSFNAVASSIPSTADCTTIPAGPTNLLATALDAQNIALNWTDNSAVEDGFKVYRSENNAGFIELATLPPNTVMYRDVGVRADFYYTYSVQAIKDGGYSSGSNVAFGPIPTSLPSAPTDVNISFGYNTQNITGWVYLYVYWSDASTNEAGFRIEYSFDGVNDWSKYAETPPNYESFQDGYWTDAPPPELCIRVIAFNALGDSPPSNVSCGTIDLSQIYGAGMAAPNNGLSHRVTKAGAPAAVPKGSRAVVPDRAASTKRSRVKTVPRQLAPTPNVLPSR